MWLLLAPEFRHQMRDQRLASARRKASDEPTMVVGLMDKPVSSAWSQSGASVRTLGGYLEVESREQGGSSGN